MIMVNNVDNKVDTPSLNPYHLILMSSDKLLRHMKCYVDSPTSPWPFMNFADIEHLTGRKSRMDTLLKSGRMILP